MSAVLRCVCGRCAGGVRYARVSDYLDAHQLDAGEYVLESEVALDGSRDRHPSGRTRVATFDDGSQILVSEWPDEIATVATRGARWETWGPPVDLEEAP